MDKSSWKINTEGLQLIKNFEGFRGYRYKDAVGIWTIGYGHVIHSGETFKEPISEQEGNNLLLSNIVTYENGVKESVNVSLNSNQFSALVSFVYNLGVTSLQESTLLKLLNQGKYSEAAEQFLRWDRAGGEVLVGLERRREKEKELFMKPINLK